MHLRTLFLLLVGASAASLFVTACGDNPSSDAENMGGSRAEDDSKLDSESDDAGAGGVESEAPDTTGPDPIDCSTGFELCESECTDLEADDENCGECGVTCQGIQQCFEGSCVDTCAEGLVGCQGECIDPMTSNLFCGAAGSCENLGGLGGSGGQASEESAGKECDTDAFEQCVSGICELVCPDGTIECSGSCNAAGSCSNLFEYTGTADFLTIPDGIDSVQVTLAGAQGGIDGDGHENFGGLLTATIPVNSGDVLHVFVGGQPELTEGGYNGGGAGDAGGRGGGGASDIRLNGVALTDRIAIAGGGGGGGRWNGLFINGGQGGGLEGTSGGREGEEGGDGATQISSGDGTCTSFNNETVSGGLGFGGTTVDKGCGCEGYGGGGGYYGGSASGNCRGGGGGSGYTAPSIVTFEHTVGGAPAGHGSVLIEF